MLPCFFAPEPSSSTSRILSRLLATVIFLIASLAVSLRLFCFCFFPLLRDVERRRRTTTIRYFVARFLKPAAGAGEWKQRFRSDGIDWFLEQSSLDFFSSVWVAQACISNFKDDIWLRVLIGDERKNEWIISWNTDLLWMRILGS